MTRSEQVMAVREVILNAIYHGRHFSPKRDRVVEIKDVNRIFEIFNQPAPFWEEELE